MKQLKIISDSAKFRGLTGLNAITGKADESGDYYLFTDTFWRAGAINAGVTIQPSVSVTVSYTLAPKEWVLANPSSVPWTTAETVGAGVANNDFPIGFTVMKINFSAAGFIHVVAY